MSIIQQYELAMNNIPYVKDMYKRIIKLISKFSDRKHETKILEIGCGTGTFMVELANAFPNVKIIGLEPNAKFASTAQSKLSRHTNSKVLPQKLADYHPDQKFDFIILSFVYHHISDDQKSLFLTQIKRLLAVDGLIILGDEFITDYHSEYSKYRSINTFYNKLDQTLIVNNAADTTLKLSVLARKQSLDGKIEHKVSVYEFKKHLKSTGLKIVGLFHLWPNNKRFGCKIFVIKKEKQCL